MRQHFIMLSIPSFSLKPVITFIAVSLFWPRHCCQEHVEVSIQVKAQMLILKQNRERFYKPQLKLKGKYGRYGSLVDGTVACSIKDLGLTPGVSHCVMLVCTSSWRSPPTVQKLQKQTVGVWMCSCLPSLHSVCVQDSLPQHLWVQSKKDNDWTGKHEKTAWRSCQISREQAEISATESSAVKTNAQHWQNEGLSQV